MNFLAIGEAGVNEEELVNVLTTLTHHDDKKEFENRSEHVIRLVALLCLRYRHYDIEKAKKRYISYLTWRRSFFGHLHHVTLKDDEVIREQLRSGFAMVLPNRTTNGEAIIYIRPRYHNPNNYTAEQVSKCVHYLMMSTFRLDTKVQQSGFVLIGSFDGVSLSNIDYRIPEVVGNSINKIMPARLNALLLIEPSYLIQFIIPIVRLILPEKLNKRLHVITNLQDLQEAHGLPSSLLPPEIGGTLSIDLESYLSDFLKHDIEI